MAETIVQGILLEAKFKRDATEEVKKAFDEILRSSSELQAGTEALGDAAEKTSADLSAQAKATERLAEAQDEAVGTSSEFASSLDRLTERADDLAGTLGGPSVAAIAEAEQDLRRLLETTDKGSEEFRQYEEQVEKVTAQLSKAKVLLVENESAVKDLTLQTEAQVKRQRSLTTELTGGEKGFLGVARGAGLVAGAFSGGLAIGFEVVKKAGVDMTETIETANQVLEKLAKTAVSVVTPATDFLAEKINSLVFGVEALTAAEEVQLQNDIRRADLALEQAKQAEEEHKRALERQKEIADALEKQIAEEQAAAVERERIAVLRIENEIALKGATEERIQALEAALVAEAEVVAKTEEDKLAAIIAATERVDAIRAAEKAAREEAAEEEARLAAERQQAALLEARLRAENEIAARGLTEERITSLREAAAAEIESASLSAAERERLERELAERIATLRIAALGEFKNLSQEEVDAIKLKVEAILSDEQIGAETRMALSDTTSERIKDNLSSEARWATLTAQQKTDTAVGAGQAVLGAASQAFGEQKEFAIANALINTYQSATGAYNALAPIPIVGPALGAVAAALAVIAGLKNVQQIKAAQPGGGGGGAAPAAESQVTGPATSAPSFDDPENDAAARFAGRMSARDVAGHFGDGFRSELLTGLAHSRAGNTAGPSSTTINRSESLTVNAGFGSSADDIVRDVSRSLRRRESITESRVTRPRGRLRK